MAASATVDFSYLHLGPRQGVYCRPSVVLTAVPGGGYRQQYLAPRGGAQLKWRLSQFRSPEHGYRLRARADADDTTAPETIPQIAGRIIERPSSAASSQQRTGTRPPVRIAKSRSTCNLHSHSSVFRQQQQQNSSQQVVGGGAGRLTQITNGSSTQERHRKASTAPAISVQASAVTIQPRPPARPLTPPPKRIAPPDEPFPYPDPLQVGGDHAFNIRLSEMAGLQRDTVKFEEYRVRISRRNTTASTVVSTATSGSLQSSRQPLRPSSATHRTPVSVNTSNSRADITRRTSLPAGHTTVQNKPRPSSLTTGSSRVRVTRGVGSSVTMSPSEAPFVEISAKKSLKTEVEMPLKHSSTATLTADQAVNGESCQKDTEHTVNSAEIAEKRPDAPEGNSVTAIGDDSILEVKKAIPKSYHRELVETIFSRATSPQELSTKEASTRPHSESTPCTVPSNETPPSTKHDKSVANVTESFSQTERAAAIKPSRPKSSKSKTLLHTASPSTNHEKSVREPSSQTEPVTSKPARPKSSKTSHAASPTNTPPQVSPEPSPPSTASSDHSPSPAPAGGSSKKATHHSKATKSRKTSKKTTGRHKNT